jgi:hypothetical protein
VSVRNSNSALDYRPPEELKQQPFIPHPSDLFGKQVYGHSQRFQTASGKLLLFNGKDSEIVDTSNMS